jgi:hypothetical protein
MTASGVGIISSKEAAALRNVNLGGVPEISEQMLRGLRFSRRSKLSV